MGACCGSSGRVGEAGGRPRFRVCLGGLRWGLYLGGSGGGVTGRVEQVIDAGGWRGCRVLQVSGVWGLVGVTETAMGCWVVPDWALAVKRRLQLS